MQDATANNVASGISLFTPVIDQMENRPGTKYAGNQRALYPATVWWYQSCDSFGCTAGSSVSGWPTMAIDSDATRNRAMEWMSFAYDISGELYYEVTMAYFSGDPWVNQFNFGGNGDGDLFYPGTVAKIGGQTEIPVESFRMKMIRDGMEDYELLALAKQLGLGDQAKQIARSLFPVTYQSTTTAAAIDAGRGQLAQMILRALGKDTLPDPPGSGSSGVGAVTPSTPPVQSVSSSSMFPHGGCFRSTETPAWVGLVLSCMLLARIRQRPRAPAG
jgi:hypothetical protein